VIGDGKNSPGEIELFGPQMKKRQSGTAYFPGHSGEWRNAAAVFVHFDDAGGGEFLEAGLQFSGEFHAQKYIRFIYQINYIIWIRFYVKSKKEDQRPTTKRWTRGSGRRALRMRSWTDKMS
jgi:hypothetical protein